MINKAFDFLASLRLTVVCLCLAIGLVFVGTLAQVDLGLYEAQSRFFRHFLVYWTPQGSAWKIPVYPGGWLLGTVLLVNLILAHFKRFVLTKKKIGIFLIHSGLIFLLLGQFLTEIFQTESAMVLREGSQTNFSIAERKTELVVIDPSDPHKERVVSVPDHRLAKRGEISDPALPFKIRVLQWHLNSFLTNRTAQTTSPVPATQGIGPRTELIPQAKTTNPDVRDVPSAVIEISEAGKSLGTWVVSPQILDEDRQTVTVGGKTYEIGLRFLRYYKPFWVELIKFSHDKYMGTEIPKNFSSLVRIKNPQTAENREVLIYMNSPFRTGTETYYQGSFSREDPKVSILHVVRNPAAITPYVACTMVGAGLLTQFLIHLLKFSKRRTGAPGSQPEETGGGAKRESGKRKKSEPEMAAAMPAAASKRRNK